MQPATRPGTRTRNRLLATAEEVFAELGFFPASVSEICRRAGVGQGTRYLYFDSKTDRFAAALDLVSRGVAPDDIAPASVPIAESPHAAG